MVVVPEIDRLNAAHYFSGLLPLSQKAFSNRMRKACRVQATFSAQHRLFLPVIVVSGWHAPKRLRRRANLQVSISVPLFTRSVVVIPEQAKVEQFTLSTRS
jgi:hypothetical protein